MCNFRDPNTSPLTSYEEVPPPPPGYLWHRLLQRATFVPSDDSKNYLGSTTKQGRLNICLLMHCHKSIMDTLDTVKIACANEQQKEYFQKFEYAYGWVDVSKRSAASVETSVEKKKVYSKWWWKQNINFATWNIEIANIFKILSLASKKAAWARYSEL